MANVQIKKTMRAVVMHDAMDYRLEDIAVPVPSTNELLMKVEACGVCASDLKCFHGAAKVCLNLCLCVLEK